MGVKAYLINGFNVNEEIIDFKDTLIRKDLTTPPDIIKFIIDEFDGVEIYRNTINSCVSIQLYGEFETYENAYDYFYDENNELYKNLYKNCLDTINNNYAVNLKDTDWNTLLCTDKDINENIIIDKQNIIVVKDKDVKNNIYFRGIIDSSLIYQSVLRISYFLNNLVFVEELSKFQQFQIAYYSQELFKIKSPDIFLTNTKEKEIYKNIYLQWELSSTIENVIDMVDKSISNYSFLWDYKNLSSQKFSNLMLALFTIIVGYPSLKYVCEEFLLDSNILRYLFSILLIFFIIKMIWLLLRSFKESIEFNKKRR